MDRGWFKRNWLWLTIIGIAVIAFLVYLGLKYGIAISFAVLSIFVAIFFASRSLKVTQDSLKTTRESLELSRATTRPFLSITHIVYQPPKTVEIIFCNTGALPPDSNTFQAIFSLTNDFSEPNDLNKLSIPATHESPPIFPNEKQQWDIYLTQDRADYINSGNEMYLKININYIYNGKEEGITNRVSHLLKSDGGRKREPFSILSEGSFWK